jgi:hypothetical protein
MDKRDYWHRQGNEPLFDDLLWSRPENRQLAGKLLVVGGNLHGFSAPAQAYREAEQAGVGSARVLLPGALRKTVGKVVDNADFAASNLSGGFARQALAEWLDASIWADGVLLAGDFGRNSETAIVCEQFAAKYRGSLTITKDAVDYFYTTARKLLEREGTTLVLSLAQLQKICAAAGWPQPVKFSMGLLQLVDLLYELTTAYPCNIITNHHDTIFVATGGEVSTTKIDPTETWRVRTAAYAAVWQIQNPNKPFEALTTAVLPAKHE